MNKLIERVLFLRYSLNVQSQALTKEIGLRPPSCGTNTDITAYTISKNVTFWQGFDGT